MPNAKVEGLNATSLREVARPVAVGEGDATLLEGVVSPSTSETLPRSVLASAQMLLIPLTTAGRFWELRNSV